MTTRQKTIIWSWIAALTIMSLCPPWIGPGGYLFGLRATFWPPEYGRVDFGRLILEYLVATLLAGGLCFAWPQGRVGRNTPPREPDPKHVVTWTDLAAEARSLSDKDLKNSWPHRFLAPLRNIETDKAVPGIVKLLSEIAGEDDWKELRSLLGICLDVLGELKVSPPKF